MFPVDSVKYWRQLLGALSLLLHFTWVTKIVLIYKYFIIHIEPLIVKAEVVAVVADPKKLVIRLHWSAAGTYMCWPVLVPQIRGGAENIFMKIFYNSLPCLPWPSGTVTEKKSVSQFPCIKGPVTGLMFDDVTFKIW